MRRNFFSWVLISGWVVVLTLWSKPTNLPSIEENIPKGGDTDEGLYKSTRTKANFGLLGVRFFETVNGKRHWNIESEFAELHRKENYAYLEVVLAKFFSDKTGNIVFTESDRGRAWTDKSFVELDGNVRITSQRGYRFVMEKLTYDGTGHSFASEESVTMSGPDSKKPTMFLDGTGLLANLDREHFTVKKNVRARKSTREGKWMRIRSQTGEFFTNESRGVFVGKVHAAMPDVIIDSDIFEMTMGTENDDILARGRVRLKSKDRLGQAETVSIVSGGNEIILEGKARVESPKQNLSGKRIKLFTDDERIEVEGAEGNILK